MPKQGVSAFCLLCTSKTRGGTLEFHSVGVCVVVIIHKKIPVLLKIGINDCSGTLEETFHPHRNHWREGPERTPVC